VNITRETYIGQPPLPPITDDMRADARQSPGQWMYYYDPALADTEGAPGYAVQGARWVDEHGSLTDEYWVNEKYWPSPAYAGIDFKTGFELALWQVFRSFQPAGMLVDSLYHADLLVMSMHEGDTDVHVMTTPGTGDLRVQVATSQQFVPSGWSQTHVVEGRELLVTMGQQDSQLILDINPGQEFGGQFRLADLATLITVDTADPLGHRRA
jgi:hypothetical protein